MIPESSKYVLTRLTGTYCPFNSCSMRIEMISNRPLSWADVMMTIRKAFYRPGFRTVFFSFGTTRIVRRSQDHWVLFVPFQQGLVKVLSPRFTLDHNTKEAQNATDVFVVLGLLPTENKTFTTNASSSVVVINKKQDDTKLSANISAHFESFDHFETVRSIKMCETDRYATKVIVWSSVNIKLLIVNKAKMKLVGHPGYRDVYEYHAAKKWRANNTKNKWSVLFPFKESYQWSY